jgi:hypothetical protein
MSKGSFSRVDQDGCRLVCAALGLAIAMLALRIVMAF